ncbi:MAG: hypothetical protein ACRC33_12520 [Gemmataceae bacterium]
MKASERYHLVKPILELPLADKVAVVEDIMRSIRRSLIDSAEVERELDAMIADPEFQRVMGGRGPEDLHAAG